MAIDKTGQEPEELEVVKASKKKQKSLVFRLLRIIFRTVMLLLLLGSSIGFLISFPSVQNKLVGWTSDYLTEELGAEVRVDYVNIQFFNELLLEGVYIEDLHQDTLLYAESIAANISLVDLLGSKVVVEALSLNSTTFKLQRYPGEKDQNLKFLTNFFKSEKKKESSFLFNAENVYLNKFRFYMVNAELGDYLTIELPKGRIELADVDFKNKILEIGDIEFKDLYAKYTKIEGVPVVNPDTTTIVADTATHEWTYKLNKVAILNAFFDYDNNKFEMREDGEFDIQHFDLNKLNMIGSGGLVKDYIGTWHVDEISCEESGGFIINRLEADMEIREDLMAFYNAELVTPNSYVADTIIFNYQHINDMAYFNDRVRLDVNLDGSTLAIEDILVFFPKLKKNAFFRLNKKEKFQLKGKLSNTINRLRAKDLLVTMKNTTAIKGSFSSRDLTNFDETFMDFELERFRSNMSDLKLLLPYVNFSESALRLGKIDFNGKFFGFFHEFFAKGSLRTDLGRADMDMELDLQANNGNGVYNGKLALTAFDLGVFTNNPDLGKITVNADAKGSGITFENVDATVVATIKRFSYKDYPYENIRIDGIFNKKEFEGKTSISDADIDLDFDGKVDFNAEIPKFNIRSNVKHLDLKALNLYDKDYTFAGNFRFDFQGSKLDNIVGVGSVQNFVLSNGTTHRIDSIVLRSGLRQDGYRDITLNSEVLSARLNGEFNINEIHKPFLYYVKQYYPKFAKKMNIKSQYLYRDSTQLSLQNNKDYANFYVNIFDTKNLTNLLDTNLSPIKQLNLGGSFNAAKDTFEFALEMPEFQYGNILLDSVFITTNTKKDQGSIIINVNKTKIGNSLEIPPFAFSNRLDRDTIHFNTSIASITKVFEALSINGKFFIAEDQYQVSLLPSNLSIAGKEWAIAGDNYIRFGPGFINTNDFRLQHLEEVISLNSIGAKGLELDIQKMPVDWVENFVKVKQLDFDGLVSGKVSAENMFKAEFLKAQFEVDSFFINQDYFGKLVINAQTPTINKPIVFSTKLKKIVQNENNKAEEQSITIRKGKYYLPSASNYFTPANSFNFRVQVKNYPLNFAEYFISGISSTNGKINGNLIFYGAGKTPNIGGSFKIKDITTKINYLQTTYTINESIVNVNNNIFDATGTIVKDEMGNTAIVSGGMKHRYLTDYELDISVTSQRFLMMNTLPKDENPLYGTAIGKDVTVKFTGFLNEPNLYANATSGKGTSIKIPLSGEQTAKAVNFIKFVNPLDTFEERTIKKVYGMNIELDIIATPDAEVKLIFDEQAGDIMNGRGNGRVSVTISNQGDFKMFGDYEIEQGDYLFTYQNFINKPFTVKRGGTITWNGDPYEAELNIDAYYKGLRTAPYNFIIEYLSFDSEIEAARRSTNVDLAMKLTGLLTQPDIEFDVFMPNASRELQSYIQSKLQTIRADKNELNRQVFALIILKSFLPSDAAFVQSNQIEDIGVNTVSEMLSNQLSLYLTSLISEVVADDLSFLSGIELDFNYQRNTGATTDIDNFRSVSSEFQIGLTNRLFDDRLTVGGNLGIESSSARNTYYTGDFVVEFRITDDGRFKFKGYNRTEPDIIGIATVNKTGLGFSYRREFDSFTIKKKVKIMPKQEKPTPNLGKEPTKK